VVRRVNAGGDAPPDPPSGDVTGPFPLSLFSYRKFFGEENIFSGLTVKVITRNPNKQMAGLVHLYARESVTEHKGLRLPPKELT